MRRPKWLSGWGKGKNVFQGSLIIDTQDIKVVEASFDGKLVLFAVGTAQKRDTAVSGKVNTEQNGYERKCNLAWRIFYDSDAIPDFISICRAKDFMAGAVALSSRSSSVYDKSTLYIASGNKPSKGNAPLLLDYEIAKKIEEARKILKMT